MRQGQQNKRLRGRNRKGPNPLARSYESNGPDVKIRGTALHIAEKYSQLARDAQSSGDRVMEQRYLQHAEHYYRIVAAAQAQMPQTPQHHFGMATTGRDEDEGDEAATPERLNGPVAAYHGASDQPAIGPNDPQPYVNGNGRAADEELGEAAGMDGGERDEDDGDFAGPGQGLGPRPRRRRSNRGRGRREHGEQAAPVGPQESVPSED